MSNDSSVAGLVGQWMESAKTGGASGDISSATPDSEEAVRAENSTTDDEFGGEGGDTQKDPQGAESEELVSSEAKAKTKPEASQKDVITVTDELGRRRKVEVDYSDRARIKKAFEMEAGARKWQAERDRAIRERDTERTSTQELKGNWETLDGAWQKGGVEAVVDLLEGRPGAWKERLSKEVQRTKFLEEASPAEKESFFKDELAQQQARELESIRKQNTEFQKKMTEKEEAAQLHALESRINPSFDKHRFAGRLGDADDEHTFDEMLWNSAMGRLQQYEDKGLDITPELVEQEFSSVASTIRKRIGGLAEKKAASVVKQKKEEATENVQAKVKSGYKQGGVAAEAKQMLDSGNLMGVLKGWGKYGSAFKR